MKQRETVELRTLAGDRYLEGQVFAKGDRLEINR